MKKLITLVLILLSFTTWSIAQNGLNFDGSNDFIQTTYPGVSGSANRTFEAWIFVSATAPSSNLAILDYGVNASGSRNTFSVSGTRQLIFISGGTNANISTPANSIPVGQWTHVAFVLNNGTGFLYVNGTQSGTGSLSSVNTPSGGNLRVGQRVAGGSIPFNGSIDEVRIWDIARTPTEIQADMNTEFCSAVSNLQLYLKLNEGIAGGSNTAITTAVDDSGNGNNGTLSNFTLTGTTSNWVTGSGIGTGSTTSSVQQTACGSYSLTPTSTVYTTSGIYTETLVGANTQGCDIIVTLDLTIVNNSSSTDVQTACSSYTWIDGNTYTADNNTATFTTTNAAGCDSVITLDLTILNSATTTDVQTACESYTWIDGNTYTTDNNTATFTTTNAAGCDSVITLDLTISPATATVTQDSSTLTATETGVTYQWVECPAFTPVSGATSQSFTPTTSGDYAVIVTNSSQCSDTSTCNYILLSNTINTAFEQELQVFPNPTDGNFSVDLGEKYNSATLTIMDLTGRQILSQQYNNNQLLNLNLDAPSGVYFMTIEAENKRAVIRLIKK